MEAQKSLKYSKELVENWLYRRMLREVTDDEERSAKAATIAAYFNAESTSTHGQVHVHGQRIGVEKLEDLGLSLELLEDDQRLQDDVLTAYHLMTLIFEVSRLVKFIASNEGKMWAKQELQPIPKQVSPSMPQQEGSNPPV